MTSPTSGFNALTDNSVSIKVQRASNSISRKTQWRLFIGALIFSDVLMMVAAFSLAYFIRFNLELPVFYSNERLDPGYYQTLVMVLVPILLITFALSGLYDRKNLLGGTREYSLAFNAITIGMLLVISVGFLDPTFVVARAWVILSWTLTFLFVAGSRFWLRRLVYLLRGRGYYLSPAVIVGANDEGLSLASQLKRWTSSGLHIVGFVDEKFPPGTRLVGNLWTIGRVADLDDLIKQYEIEEVILASSAISSRDRLLDIFKRYGVNHDVNVRMSSGLYEIITTGLSVKEFAYVPLVGINPVRLTGIDRFLKLVLDYSITIPGLVLISPLLLFIALLIKFTSPGPVIYRRRVMGVNGRTFDAYKFRTMYVNGDRLLAQQPELARELAENHKLKHDPRITPVGRILRKTSMDELPQLFNVLKREMSLVGPRMISPAEIEKYDQWDINLLTVQPGITGLWQVSGRSDVTYKERVSLDMHYIRNWSIWLDIQLLIQTVPAVLRGRGAY